MRRSPAELKALWALPSQLLPNTLTNADGTPYSAGYDDVMKEAKLREIVFLALGRVSVSLSEKLEEVYSDEGVVRVGDELIKQIKELMTS